MRIDQRIKEVFAGEKDGAIRVSGIRPEGFSLRVSLAFEGGSLDIKLYPAGEARSTCASNRNFDVVFLTRSDSDVDEATRRALEKAIDIIMGLNVDIGIDDWEETLGEESDSRFICGPAVEIKVTRRCNQRCIFCKSSSRLENYAKPAQMPDILERLARKADFLTLSGGETCLDPWLEKHIEQARRAGFRKVEVQTNGLLMQDRDYVRGLLSAGMTNALVSLHSHSEDVSDSITRCRGGFQGTLKGIETLLREGAGVTLCHVICSLNYRDVPGYVGFIDRRFPRSAMCLVFTLAIPTYRVRSRPRLMPGLSDLAPPLKQGLLMCLASNDAFERSALSRALDKAEAVTKRFFTAGGGLPGILRAGTTALSGGRLRARVISHCGIPLCMLEGCENYHDESAPAGSFPAGYDLFHPPACAPCKWRSNCSGIWRSYADVHGIEEVHPIP